MSWLAFLPTTVPALFWFAVAIADWAGRAAVVLAVVRWWRGRAAAKREVPRGRDLERRIRYDVRTVLFEKGGPSWVAK